MWEILPEVWEVLGEKSCRGRCLLLISRLRPCQCLVTSCVHVCCTRLIYDVDSRKLCGSVVKSKGNLGEFQHAWTVVTLRWIIAVVSLGLSGVIILECVAFR